MSKLYWWSRFGSYSPGEGILPHSGEVVAAYRRRRGFKTQAEFATATGATLRSVSDWENKTMIREPDRRIFLAKLLKIPPMLLGLDWRLVAYQDNTGTHENPSEFAEEIWLEDSYYHYEDTLAMAWDAVYSGRMTAIADRFERRLQKLIHLVKNVSGPDREAWLGLLCQYYQIALSIPQYRGLDEINKNIALQRSRLAVQVATEIDDHELLAAALFRLADTHRSYDEHARAKDVALKAIQYVEQVPDSTRGNLYMIAFDASARLLAADKTLLKEVRGWQDKALHVVHRGNLEPDRGFFRLNLAAVHHERAKALLKIFQAFPEEKKVLKDAQHEMKLAWGALTPDVSEWRMYFFDTEARLYMAMRDLEKSARLGLDALKEARTTHSQKGEGQVRDLYLALKQLDEYNPYVCNLGVQLGQF